jgi:hypothetical protein
MSLDSLPRSCRAASTRIEFEQPAPELPMDDKGEFALVEIGVDWLRFALLRTLAALGQSHSNQKTVKVPASAKPEQKKAQKCEDHCGEHEQNGPESAIRSFFALRLDDLHESIRWCVTKRAMTRHFVGIHESDRCEIWIASS